MESVGKPLQQTWLGRGQIDICHANLGKSECAGPVLHLKNQPRTVDLIAADHHLPIVKTLAWHSEADTAAFAAALARKPALRTAFIALQGELGAGKTSFVRHLLRALGVGGRIKSPTYAVVEPHEVPGLAIWHFDFYRFDDPREWEDAGFRDVFASAGLKLAEWPDKAAALLPVPDLVLAIAADEDGTRHATLTAQSAIGAALLA